MMIKNNAALNVDPDGSPTRKLLIFRDSSAKHVIYNAQTKCFVFHLADPKVQPKKKKKRSQL